MAILIYIQNVVAVTMYVQANCLRLMVFKIGHINVNNLHPKIVEICFPIKKTNLDILCFSKTWLNKI